MKVLLIEDDADTARFIRSGLAAHGHVMDHVENGREALLRAMDPAWDLLIVDRMLPALDGLTLVKMLRVGGCHTPVLFLSALGGLDDRVNGLDAGGDDYLIKPFAMVELLARAHALSRRMPTAEHSTVLRVGDLELDLLARAATRGGRRIGLQTREFQLLQYLMRHADQVVTRTMLLEQVWRYNFDPETTIVETQISHLRSKIDKGFDRDLIQTVRGVGYCLRASA